MGYRWQHLACTQIHQCPIDSAESNDDDDEEDNGDDDEDVRTTEANDAARTHGHTYYVDACTITHHYQATHAAIIIKQLMPQPSSSSSNSLHCPCLLLLNSSFLSHQAE